MGSQTILVTGGAGFVGRWLVKGIRSQLPDFKVVVLDLERLQGWDDAVEFIKVDMTDFGALHGALRSVLPAAIIHSAGIVPTVASRYETILKETSPIYAVNVTGTANILEAAKSVGVKHFIYTSSTTVIIDDPSKDHVNMNEQLPTGNATLNYGRTKGLAEAMVLEANDSTSMTTCALRPSVIFGPGDNNTIPTIHSCIAKGETPFVIGDPSTSLYDFTYVENVADAHVLALKNLMTTSEAAGRAFFITNGEPLAFRDFCLAVWHGFGHIPKYQIKIPLSVAWFAGLVAEGMTKVTGGTATLSRGSVRDYTMSAYCDITNAREVLGYEPRVSIVDGIRLSCEVSQ